MSKKQQSDEYEPIHTARAFEEVVAQIRRRVIQGQLRPGDRLPAERDLAAKLGVSRNTVREALRGLEMAGVLRLQKGVHGGAFVVIPNGDTVGVALQDMFQLGSVSPEQLTEVRLHMTAIVVRIVCQDMKPGLLDELEASVDAALAATQAGQYAERSNILLEMHNILARATGNPILVAIMKGLIAITQGFVVAVGPLDGLEVFAARRRFIEHLRANRPEQAIEQMATSLRTINDFYNAKAAQQPAAAAAEKKPAAAKKPRAANTAAKKAVAKSAKKRTLRK